MRFNKEIFLDVETYSEVDIMSSGAYKYILDPSFQVLLLSYAIGDGEVKTVDLACGEEMPEELEEALFDSECIKWAHNAVFERQALKRIGYDIPIEEWRDSAIKAAYCGLPLSLDNVSKALGLTEGKLDTGKALIKYFSCPCKPTKTNGMRVRNFPRHDPEKWEQYKTYNNFDVRAEREIVRRLEAYDIPDWEQALYVLDQQINDRGILMDLKMARNAIRIDEAYKEALTNDVKKVTGVDNPGSVMQLKSWLLEQTGEVVESLNKKDMPGLLANASGPVRFVLEARQRLGKTSVKKYTAMLNCACKDNRARGLFQFYGANRTGRWAGRLVQLQNLPQNHINDLELARKCVVDNDAEMLEIFYDNVPDALSQLIRTAFIAPEGKTFVVADFSAIEARVLSWIANEEWRLEVFRTHGKIYEAAAALMFGLPIEMIKKGSPERQKGKIAELALGYGGSLGALKRMGGEAMGLSTPEMMSIVRKWRAANQGIVDFWAAVQDCAVDAVRHRTKVICEEYHNLEFACNTEVLTIKLPSGRQLFYRSPRIANSSKGEILMYKGINQETKQWSDLDTYGGKLTENIVQATARDLLAISMLKLSKQGYPIVMHVHDECIAEVPIEQAAAKLSEMCEIMGQEVSWAKGLPLRADGYYTPFYKKD